MLSVSDKEGLIPFAKGLVELGYSILSTGGTASFLSENGIAVTLISDYTGQQEILDGRVKTLHPKIHGGILARRNRPDDLKQLANQGISPIDLVVVNLYPFSQKVREVSEGKRAGHETLVEFIDIGGPTMIRAAAKNCADVLPVIDPSDYAPLLDELRTKNGASRQTRLRLAAKVFSTMAAYDGAVGRYFSLEENLFDEHAQAIVLAPVETLVLVREEALRYGENPHQRGAFYRPLELAPATDKRPWKLHQGKQLSYNNLLDAEAAIDLFIEFLPDVSDRSHLAVVIKHSNPCGVAMGETPVNAFTRARDCDPLSAFGGIVVVSGALDRGLAEVILEGFVEVVIVGSVTDAGLEAFRRKPNVRLIECDFSSGGKLFRTSSMMIRRALDGYLLQEPDHQLSPLSSGKVVAGAGNLDAVLRDLQFAWRVCKHVKSNTIVLAKELRAIGVGAGQMSRVDAAKLAIQRARDNGHEVSGSVAASDAFLPFPDTLEVLGDQGVIALVQPGGSVKDDLVIQAAVKRKMTMIFTDERHFRH